MNTFAFVGDLEKSPEVSCVYHSEDAENQVSASVLTQRCCLLKKVHHRRGHVLGAVKVLHCICQKQWWQCCVFECCSWTPLHHQSLKVHVVTAVPGGPSEGQAWGWLSAKAWH